jgi:hypothetical protein
MAKQLGNLKKYQCGLCEKIVTNIQIHVRRHTNDKPYPWSIFILIFNLVRIVKNDLQIPAIFKFMFAFIQ